MNQTNLVLGIFAGLITAFAVLLLAVADYRPSVDSSRRSVVLVIICFLCLVTAALRVIQLINL